VVKLVLDAESDQTSAVDVDGVLNFDEVACHHLHGCQLNVPVRVGIEARDFRRETRTARAARFLDHRPTATTSSNLGPAPASST
jgi:hypothetical protein